VRVVLSALVLVAAAGGVRAQETPAAPIPSLDVGPAGGPPPGSTRPLTRLWPLTLGVHAMIGVEPHIERGNPMAFGVGVEAMWRGRLGGFASVLSSEGTPILPQTTGKIVNGMPESFPSLGDRVSVPFGLVWRPFTTLAPQSHAYVRQLLAGMGLQVGLTVEHVRTSDDSATLVGFHAAASVEVPLFGGPTESGVTLRLQGRLLATAPASLDTKIAQSVYEGPVSGQFYAGLAYYP
jgi:hypothetical protein